MQRLRQRIAAALLAYAAYITYNCPCRKINGCHWRPFLLSVGVGSAIVVYDNC